MAQELVLWARKNRVSLAGVKVGAVELAITSMMDAVPLPTEAEAKVGLYQRFGGDALAAEEAAQKTDDVYDEED